MAKERCIKANGPAPNAEPQLVNCLLNQTVPDQSFVKIAIRKDEGIEQAEEEEDSFNEKGLLRYISKQVKKTKAPYLKGVFGFESFGKIKKLFFDKLMNFLFYLFNNAFRSV